MVVGKQVARWISSCVGLGFSRYAPGTVGSFGALISFYCLHFCIPIYGMAALTVIACVVGFWATAQSIETSTDDPAWIVIDEWVAVWGIALFLPHHAGIYFLSCLIFRLLDIVKPWPVCAMQSLPGAWGIFADDIVAGFLTAIFLCCVVIPVIL